MPDSPSSVPCPSSLCPSAASDSPTTVPPTAPAPPDSRKLSASRAELLGTLRRAWALSQEQVASLLSISRQSYGYYERGERTLPPDVAGRLSRLYGIETDYLTGEPSPDQVLPPVTAEEKDLLTCYRLLDSDGRKQILDLIHYEARLMTLPE